MGYVVGLCLQNPELKIFISIRHSIAEILNVKVWEINNFLFIFLIFLNPIANGG